MLPYRAEAAAAAVTTAAAPPLSPALTARRPTQNWRNRCHRLTKVTSLYFQSSTDLWDVWWWVWTDSWMAVGSIFCRNLDFPSSMICGRRSLSLAVWNFLAHLRYTKSVWNVFGMGCLVVCRDNVSLHDDFSKPLSSSIGIQAIVRGHNDFGEINHTKKNREIRHAPPRNEAIFITSFAFPSLVPICCCCCCYSPEFP